MFDKRQMKDKEAQAGEAVVWDKSRQSLRCCTVLDVPVRLATQDGSPRECLYLISFSPPHYDILHLLYSTAIYCHHASSRIACRKSCAWMYRPASWKWKAEKWSNRTACGVCCSTASLVAV